MTLLAIDPGTRALGWALFDVALVRAGVVRGSEVDMMVVLRDEVDISTVSLAVVELPSVYGPAAKADPNDLVYLAFRAGIAVGMFGPCSVGLFTPREWKGQVPKGVMEKRIMKALDEEERRVIKRVKCVPSLLHNMVDAVGIGLFALGRLG